MAICHIGIYTKDIERLAGFYVRYFHGYEGSTYRRAAGDFSSRFVTFGSGASLELMTKPEGMLTETDRPEFGTGFAHVAFRLDSEQAVDDLTARMRGDGVDVLSGPRRTGDGYYESCVLDPDGNRVEITCG